MTTALITNFISHLDSLGLKLAIQDNALVLRAARGKLTPVMKSRISSDTEITGFIQLHKQELMNAIQTTPKVISAYKLSPMQAGILYHSLLNKESAAYTEQVACDFNVALNVTAFAEAWRHLANRYSIIRTKFTYDQANMPLQCVFNQVDVPFTELDFSKLDGAEQQQKIVTCQQQEVSRGFSFDDLPLMRLMTIKLSDNRYHMIWTYHHILLDGWSVSVLSREFLKTYQLLCEGKKPEYTVDHYEDFIAYIAKADEGLGFWKEYLHNSQPTLLPFVNQPSKRNQGSGAYGRTKWTADAVLNKALHSYLKKYRITASTLVQGAWSILLSKYTGLSTITFGLVSSGRPETLANAEDRVGLYINTLPCTVTLEDSSPVHEWLTSLLRPSAKARAFQYLPLTDLKSIVGISGDWFDTLLVFENYPLDQTIANQTVLPAANLVNTERSNYTLSIVATYDHQLSVTFVYDNKQLSEEQVARIAGHFNKVLSQMVVEPTTRLEALEIITDSEKSFLLRGVDNMQIGFPSEKTVLDIFSEQVKRQPNRIAVTSGNSHVSFQTLDHETDKLAHYAMTRVNSQAKPIGICMDRSYQLIAAIFAILKMRCPYLPIDPEYPQARIDYLLENAGVEFVLTETKYRSKIGSHYATIALDDEWDSIVATPRQKLNLTSTPEDSVYLIYTSGTTGLPKGTEITHRNLVRLFFSEKPVFDFTPDDVWTQFHSISFDFSVWEIFGALLHGGRLVIVPPAVAKETSLFAKLISEQRVTVLNQTPSAFFVLQDIMLELNYEHAIRYLIFGGEALATQKLVTWRAQFPKCRLVNMYGITETTVVISVKHLLERDLHSGRSNIGSPIPTLGCLVLDNHKKLLPVGVPGELYVFGHGLTNGYLSNPQLTAQKFLDGSAIHKELGTLYRTGDLVQWTSDGDLEYLGRIDDQVKIRGLRIELGEIEFTLHKLPGVRDCTVVVNSNSEEQKYLVAFVSSDTTLDTKKLREELTKTLPRHMCPSEIMQVDVIPLTANGKIDKKKLLALLYDHSSPDRYDAPTNELEKSLVELFQKILHLDRVGINDNFFEIGGHSLNAVQLVFRLSRELGLTISLADLLHLQCVKRIAEHLALTKSATESAGKIPITEQRYFPLTPNQQRLWAFEQLHPQQTAYTISSAFRLLGPCDTDWLMESIRLICKRHSILRSNFLLVQGQPRQVVRAEGKEQIECIDLQGNTDAWEKLERHALRTSERPFNLSSDSLIRVSLFILAPEEHVLQFNIHHLVFDGWSQEIFYDELCQIYNGKKTAQQAQLNPLTIQYRDYAAWLEKSTSTLPEIELIEWQNHLKGLERVKLPLSKKRSQVTFEGATHEINFSKNTIEHARRFASQQQVTLFSFLLTLIKSFLFKQTGQEKIGLLTATAGRPVPETEFLIGFFVNTIPIVTTIDGRECFENLLRKEHHALLHGLEQHNLSIDTVLECLDEMPGHISQPNPFNVMVVLQNLYSIRKQTPKLNQLQVEPLKAGSNQARFDMTFNFIEGTDGSLGLNLDYPSSLFDSDAMQLFASRLSHWIETVLNAPTTPIELLNYVPDVERKYMLESLNDTNCNYQKFESVTDAFRECVQRSGEEIAIHAAGANYTYKTLHEKSDQIARKLIDLGVKIGDRIAVSVDPSHELIFSLFAIWKAGCVYVPVPKELPDKRKQFIAEEAQASIILTDRAEEWQKTTTNLDITNLNLTDEIPSTKPLTPRFHKTAYVIFTSGSTGTPKGVPINHSSLVDRILYHIDYLELNAKTRFLQFASIGFDASLAEILMPLLCGGTLVIPAVAQRRNIPLLVRYINQAAVTAAIFSPSFLAELEGQDLPSVQLIISTGEAASVKQALHYSKSKKFYNGYGPTETCFGATFFRMGSNVEHKMLEDAGLPIGSPFANTKVYIVDASKQLQGIGMWGEIAISGVGLSEGYVNDPEGTRLRFIENSFSTDQMYSRLYLTGDRGRWNRSGYLEYGGRLDDQVQIFGVRIEPGEIESAIRKVPGVQNVAVIIDAETDKSITALYTQTTATEHNVGTDAIRKFLQSELPMHMIPGKIILVEKLPLTLNGKLDKTALAQLLSQHTSKREELLGDEVELSAIWENVLGVSHLDPTTHFLEYGGSSLKAIKLVSRIFSQRGIQIPLADVYRYPTLRSMSAYLSSLKTSQPSPDTLFEDQQYYPLSLAQERIWVLQNYQESASFFNMYAVTAWEGDLEIPTLQQAFLRLQQKYTILTSRFFTKDGNPYYRLGSEAQIVRQLSSKSDRQSEDIIRLEITRPFDFRFENLVRCIVVSEAPHTHKIALVTHHLIADGVSMKIMLNEILKLYNQKESRPAALLHENDYPDAQYKDFTIMERVAVSNGHYRVDQEYWHQHLSPPRTRFDFKLDFQRDTVRSFRGKRIIRKIPNAVLKKIGALCRSAEVSEFAVHLSGVYLLIHKLTGVSDIIIGTDSAGRNNSVWENQLGLFLNTLALRLTLSPRWDFFEMVKEVHTIIQQSLQHEKYPFHNLVEELDEQHIGRVPFFDVFVLNQKLDIASPVESVPGTRWSPIDVVADSSKFELSFIFTEHERNTSIELEYNEALYENETIISLANQYVDTLDEFTTNPTKRFEEANLTDKRRKPGNTANLRNMMTNNLEDKTVE